MSTIFNPVVKIKYECVRMNAMFVGVCAIPFIDKPLSTFPIEIKRYLYFISFCNVRTIITN